MLHDYDFLFLIINEAFENPSDGMCVVVEGFGGKVGGGGVAAAWE